ncbi:5-formyltetrahydrofolate cyclo-ligase [Pacificibacter maritimus]|uniref:5-formyltetrahydrofolate cyclo-ligase n=1 Tax=Pacificibacter maritimus TaxID=762213 RepID=A0A3N4VDY1_9RHOB|nr:5-formyltetrahydrofolate cyclo-ligase [Pacificibacter maritimus]RPE72060.1 5-formyltetrahydrofolate cyclo-ligase [Pacificibacter maritimus]
MAGISVDLKAIARKKALKTRGIVHGRDQGLNAQATVLLTNFLTPYFGKVIAGYMPIRSEINPLPCMQNLTEHGPVAVPVVEANAAPLRFDLWTSQTEMVEGAFGAAVPKHSSPVTPDVVIVPLVAFNRAGHRLGYGGGFYDRTLAKLRKSQDVFAVGFAYAGQEMSDFPVSHFDAPLDAIVTETEVFTV